MTLLDECSNIDSLNKTSRGRAVAARRAHNPEVAGSSPVPATKQKPESVGLWFFVSPAHCDRHFSEIGGISYEPQFARSDLKIDFHEDYSRFARLTIILTEVFAVHSGFGPWMKEYR